MSNKFFELPPWYDEGKYYEIVKEFNIFDFFYNLNLRYIIAGHICPNSNYSSQIKKVKSDIIKSEDLKTMMSQWLNFTLERVPYESMQHYYKNLCGESVVDNDHLRENTVRDQLYKKTLHPLSWREIKAIDLKLQSLTRSELTKKEQELYNIHLDSHISQFNVERETKNFHQSIKEFVNQKTFDVIYEPICSYLGGEGSHNIQINIDLRSPDSALINDFKSLLNSLRQDDDLNFHGGKETNHISLGRWIEFKLFEYFDLTLWFAYTGQKITDPQIANILFPDELDKDVTAIIRGSTRKYIDYYLTEQFHEKLYWEVWVFLDKLKYSSKNS